MVISFYSIAHCQLAQEVWARAGEDVACLVSNLQPDAWVQLLGDQQIPSAVQPSLAAVRQEVCHSLGKSSSCIAGRQLDLCCAAATQQACAPSEVFEDQGWSGNQVVIPTVCTAGPQAVLER